MLPLKDFLIFPNLEKDGKVVESIVFAIHCSNFFQETSSVLKFPVKAC